MMLTVNPADVNSENMSAEHPFKPQNSGRKNSDRAAGHGNEIVDGRNLRSKRRENIQLNTRTHFISFIEMYTYARVFGQQPKPTL